MVQLQLPPWGGETRLRGRGVSERLELCLRSVEMCR